MLTRLAEETLIPYQYNYQNPLKYKDPDGRNPIRVAKMAVKIAWKTYKRLKKMKKFNRENFFKAIKDSGVDEIVDIVGDLYTIVDSESTWWDRTKASVDIVTGLETNSKGNKAAAKAMGIVSDSKKQTKGGVYVLKDKKGEVKRSGRSKDLKRREGEHARSEDTKDLKFETVHETDDYNEQRGLEQIVYDEHEGTASSSNGGLNKRRGISETNKKKDIYMDAAKKYLKRKK